MKEVPTCVPYCSGSADVIVPIFDRLFILYKWNVEVGVSSQFLTILTSDKFNDKIRRKTYWENILVIETLDPDPLEMLDPDLINPDPQHWFFLIFVAKLLKGG